MGVSYFKILRKILPGWLFLWFVTRTPVYVVGRMKTEQGLNGLLVTNAILPAYLIKKKRQTFINIRQILRFIEKIAKDKCCIGLGAWWPIVSKRGALFQKYAAKNIKWSITNGHCGTLISIYLSVLKIINLWEEGPHTIKVAIIGAGKMGTACAKVLLGTVGKIVLIDKNAKKLDLIQTGLAEIKSITDVVTFCADNTHNVQQKLQEYDIVVCTTSNIAPVLTNLQLPDNIIVIDDSRPEAFHRTHGETKSIVLEGGLMKIKGFSINYDFGFGQDDNVFGCLAEVFLLTLDRGRSFKPTLGDVQFDNFKRMIKFCSDNGVTVGDFKSGDVRVGDDAIKAVRKNRPTESKTIKKTTVSGKSKN